MKVPSKIKWGDGEYDVTENRLRYFNAIDFCRNKRVIDVGCKYGVGTKILSEVCDITATDKYPIFHYEDRIPFVRADWLLETPFEDEFDLAVCLEVVEHVPHPERIIKNIKKALKPEGEIILSTPSVDRKIAKHLKPFYTLDEIRELLDGFALDYEVNFLGLSWYVHGKLEG